MAPLLPFENLDAGGVDSRSNPLNFPRNRALRCLNWVPKQAGFWEQRWGYSSVTMSTVSASAIHSMFPYRTWDGHKYVLFMSNDKSLNVLDTATGTVTTPAVKGTAVASTSKGNGYFAANRFHYGNGTDQKWFDGSAWRDNGLPALTAAQVQNVIIAPGMNELPPSQAAAVTLTPGAGGYFPGDTGTGRLIYVAPFDTNVLNTYPKGEIGPATIFVGSGRVVVPNGDKLTVANLPNWSGNNPAWVKLIAGTDDGGDLAYFFTNTTTNINSCTNGAGGSITVSATAHGLFAGDVVILTGTGNFDGVYYVYLVIDVDTFAVGLPLERASLPSTGALGYVQRIVQAGNAVTSVDVQAATVNTSYQVNQDRGVAASTVGGANPGYQFYASIYNPNGGGHVGNRIPIGGRFTPTYRTNVRIYNLPTLTDTEQTLVLGRTIDGGTTPNIGTDPNINWAVVVPGQLFSGSTAFVFTQGDLDGQHVMPTRNGIIPSECNMFAVAGTFIYAADPNSPYVRRSGDLSTNTEQGDTFTGRAEQSWAPDDIDTFQTGEALTGLFSVNSEIFCGTLHDCDILVNISGVPQWLGPWNVGVAGPRAGTMCGPYGFCWMTGDKQLCTFSSGVPVVISEEYEAAELAQIGSQYLNAVELNYYRNAELNKDELRIEGRKSDGTPYTIIHDFKLRELYTAPGSIYGQGYSSTFAGPLGTAFTSMAVRDSEGELQIFAGASTGQIYEIYSGADDAGNQFNSDLILLARGGPNRPSVPYLDYTGDSEIQITLGRNFSTSLAPGAQFGFEPPNADADVAQLVPGAEQDFLFRVYFVPPEVRNLYLRFQLASHSADSNLNLNSPPHLPLENYGRLYQLVPTVGDERDN